MIDWYKDYNIRVITSMKSGEAYCQTLGDIKIDDDWGSNREPKDNYKTTCHKTFAFLLMGQIKRSALMSCCKNIEKLYLLLILEHESSLPYAFNIKRLIKPEGDKAATISQELAEDIAGLTLDEKLRKATKGKEIYFFKRAEWQIDIDVETKVRARFNFLVLDKEKIA